MYSSVIFCDKHIIIKVHVYEIMTRKELYLFLKLIAIKLAL